MRTRKSGTGLEWVLPKEYRRDSWVCDILRACDGKLSEIVLTPAVQLAQELLLDHMSLRQLQIEERLCGITPQPGASIPDRKAAVAARWKTGGSMSLAQLQAICDGWESGYVKVDYVHNRLKALFRIEPGVPVDFNGLKAALEDARPAHIPIDYASELLREMTDILSVKNIMGCGYMATVLPEIPLIENMEDTARLTPAFSNITQTQLPEWED